MATCGGGGCCRCGCPVGAELVGGFTGSGCCGGAVCCGPLFCAEVFRGWIPITATRAAAKAIRRHIFTGMFASQTFDAPTCFRGWLIAIQKRLGLSIRMRRNHMIVSIEFVGDALSDSTGGEKDGARIRQNSSNNL